MSKQRGWPSRATVRLVACVIELAGEEESSRQAAYGSHLVIPEPPPADGRPHNSSMLITTHANSQLSLPLGGRPESPRTVTERESREANEAARPRSEE